MCGIFGGTVTPAEATCGLSYLKRGHDGTRVAPFADLGVTLAFKRHAIIAPKDQHSMQPIASADNKTHLVMNGEIFRYRELRTQLQREGLHFASDGDAEVLLNLYKSKRDHFCDDLDAQYAAAILDFSADYPRLLILRDWVGELPLHYVYNRAKRQFVFSSEIKGFFGLKDYNFDDVRELEPGTIFEVNLKDFSSRQWKYYELPRLDPSTFRSLEQIGTELRTRLEHAAAERIISDVPVCALFSGGVDSTVTAYLVNQLLKRRGQELKLYTFHVEEEPIVEGTDIFHARLAAKALGLAHNLVEVQVPQQEAVNALDEVIYALEDKRLKDFNVFPAIYNYFIARRIAKDGYKVAFMGEGSDELQGSYGSWGSFKVDPTKIVQPEYRHRLVQNLHKGVLLRSSKVMMHAGPVEMRTLFLSRNVAEFLVNVPPQFLREEKVWKLPLVQAFKDVIPEEILRRPKARPQDVTGIMELRPLLLKKYNRLGKSDDEIFKNLFKKIFVDRSRM